MSTVDNWLSQNKFVFTITGGAGFIGSNLALKLLNSGQKVRVVDNLSTGLPQNIEDLRRQAQAVKGDFTFFEGSITDSNLLSKAFEGCDFVLHQGALGSVPRSIEDPWASHEANVDGTLKVFNASRSAKVRRIVYASSSSVYGNSEVRPNKEGFESDPLSPYAVTKKINELYAKNFASVYKQSIVGLRYFNVFGPRQSPNSRYAAVIPKFIKAYMLGEAPTIFGDGKTSRDFTYIDNVVIGNLLACKCERDVDGQVFNIACSQNYSLAELAAGLKKISGSALEAEYADARPGDIKFSQANIAKAQDFLGFSPVMGFEEGLRHTYEWWQNNRSLL